MELSSLTQTNIRLVGSASHFGVKHCAFCISVSKPVIGFFSLPFITATADGPKHIETTLTRGKFEELCSDLLDRYSITPHVNIWMKAYMSA